MSLTRRRARDEREWWWSQAAHHMHQAEGFMFCDGVRRCVRMHRIAFEAFVGPMDKGRGYHGAVVMHTCDVRSCCNPDHLRLGTQADNLADMATKQRGNIGAKRPMAKLSDDDVRAIRQSSAPQKELAAQYGISQQLASAVRRGIRWKHVT